MAQVNGSVHLTQDLSLLPFEEGTFCAVPTYTFLKPGSNRVEVMLKNITARPIMIKQWVKVAVIEALMMYPKC